MFSGIGKIGVIAAHPDDEVLGCGGTIAKLHKEGKKIRVLFLGHGLDARSDDPYNYDIIWGMKDSAAAALNTLGQSHIDWCDFPDNRYDSVPLLNIVRKVEKFLSEHELDLIFTHYSCDLNVDHQVVNRAVMTACRPITDWCPQYILTFPILSSTGWFWGSRDNTFDPDVFVGLGQDEIDAKVKALGCYTSEIGKFPFPRSAEAITYQARYYGSMANVEYAEAFKLVVGFTK